MIQHNGSASSRSKENEPRAVMEAVRARIERRVNEIGLPANVEMEREALCAAMLGDPKFTPVLMTMLTVDDFASPVHKLMFDALQRGWESGVPFSTPATLVQWIRDSGVLPKLRAELNDSAHGVNSFLRACLADGLAVNAEYYAITLRRLKLERDVWLVLYDATIDAKELAPLAWLEKYRDRIAGMLPPGV